MAFGVREVGKVRIVDIEGKVVFGGKAEALRQSVDLLLDAGFRNIVLNMQQMKAIDSAGVGELVLCKKKALAKGGDVKLLMPSRDIGVSVSVLSLCGFGIFESEREAIESF